MSREYQGFHQKLNKNILSLKLILYVSSKLLQIYDIFLADKQMLF